MVQYSRLSAARQNVTGAVCTPGTTLLLKVTHDMDWVLSVTLLSPASQGSAQDRMMGEGRGTWTAHSHLQAHEVQQPVGLL